MFCRNQENSKDNLKTEGCIAELILLGGFKTRVKLRVTLRDKFELRLEMEQRRVYTLFGDISVFDVDRLNSSKVISVKCQIREFCSKFTPFVDKRYLRRYQRLGRKRF